MNDAVSWWRYFEYDLDVAPADIAVLTAPGLTLEQLARRVSVTSDAGAAEALEKARQSTVGKRTTTALEAALCGLEAAAEGGRGILVWSGHGTNARAIVPA